MSFTEKNIIVKIMRVFGYMILIASTFLIINLGITWFSWSTDRADYNEVTAVMDEDNIINYTMDGKNYIVDTVGSDSYKKLDITKIFEENKRVKMYCSKEDKGNCLYLDYNYTNPFRTIIISILIALLGGFLVFPNRVVDGFLYAKDEVRKNRNKKSNKKKNKTKK